MYGLRGGLSVPYLLPPLRIFGSVSFCSTIDGLTTAQGCITYGTTLFVHGVVSLSSPELSPPLTLPQVADFRVTDIFLGIPIQSRAESAGAILFDVTARYPS